MADRSINISTASGQTEFTPDPLNASANDIVSWANRTNIVHQIAINGAPAGSTPQWVTFTDKIEPFTSSSPAYVCQATSAQYKCVIDGHTESGTINIVALLMCVLLLGIFAPALRAQTPQPVTGAIDCGPIIGKALQDVPEIFKTGGDILKGTLVTAGSNIRMPFVVGNRQAGSLLNANGTVNTTKIQCIQQWVRAYSKDAPRGSQDPGAPVLNPLPGPTLRGSVGDLIEITFLDLIDPLNFPRADIGKCDQFSTVTGGTLTQVYPTTDKYPDCFNESINTNVHFHGTHTNPNSSGDNVFLQLKPSPRTADAKRTPAIDLASVQGPFTDFFHRCEAELPSATVPKQWPKLWLDAPEKFRQWAEQTVSTYAPDWYKQNLKAIANGAWPQYYVGAFPYCYRLPDYTSSTWPPASPADMMSAHADGAGADEMDESQAPVRPLIMGQAPGTHWYHAHKHGSTTMNVNNGMTGVFVIEGKYDKEIKAGYPGGIKQQVLVIQQLGGTSFLERGAGGTDPYFSVNGQLQPVITMRPGEVQWWRIANTSSRAGTYFLSPTTGLKWKQLAQDGVQFNDVNYQASNNNAFLLSSGNRADLLVQAPTAAGTYAVLVNNSVDPSDRAPGATQLTLLTVNVLLGPSANMQFLPNAPSFPPFLVDIKPSELKATRTIVFSTSSRPPFPSMHRIDGKLFDGEVGAAVVLNQVEEWKIVNETYANGGGGAKISHPFHIHINPFQISEFFDPSAYISSTAGAGTVTAVKATPPQTGGIITGVGTSFTTSAHVGDFILINGQRPATILSIQSNTALTFSSAINVTTASSYSIAVPLYTVNPKQVRTGQCLINPLDAKPCTALPDKNRIWWDVLAIPSGNVFYDATNPATSYQVPGYFKMQSRFVDYAGYYVIHCHILAHEDRGMMTVVYVTPLQPPFSHH
jgi:FtsP/CotA-like multicopper oxidase with cupredoxin domain